MTYAADVLDYLWSISPGGATNGQVARQLGIDSHQTVYMVTRDLLRRGLVRAARKDRTWVFYAGEGQTMPSAAQARDLTPGPTFALGALAASAFEALARRALSDHYGAALSPGSVPGVRKQFDFVSPDRQVVGDAKYYTRVGGIGLPPAKFSIIAEHVWLLEKTRARTKFLVFGNDRKVPTQWLGRYGNLAIGVAFYFLSDEGRLELLADADNPA